jgi:hypothetical protein
MPPTRLLEGLLAALPVQKRKGLDEDHRPCTGREPLPYERGRHRSARARGDTRRVDRVATQERPHRPATGNAAKGMARTRASTGSGVGGHASCPAVDDATGDLDPRACSRRRSVEASPCRNGNDPAVAALRIVSSGVRGVNGVPVRPTLRRKGRSRGVRLLHHRLVTGQKCVGRKAFMSHVTRRLRGRKTAIASSRVRVGKVLNVVVSRDSGEVELRWASPHSPKQAIRLR